MRAFLIALALMATGASAAVAQQNDVKGWITRPKPPAEAPGAAEPAAQDTKKISRGRNDQVAPAQVAEPEPQPEPVPETPVDPGGQPEGRWLVASDAQAIQQAMLNAGYRADLQTDDYGDPLIVSEGSRSQYWIQFLDCQDGDCLAVEFYVAYSYTTKPAAEVVNDFNSRFRYVRAYVNGELISMAMDVLMRDGGINEATFLEYVRLWESILGDWENTMGL